MTSTDLLAEHDLADGSTLSLRRPRRGGGDYELTAHLRGKGLEVGWQFDGVAVRPHEIVLVREHGSYPLEQLVAGSLEGTPTEYGAVGAALRRIAAGQPAADPEVTPGAE